MALRHSSISPRISNRTSPPITRSASRNGPHHTSTPVSFRSIQPELLPSPTERVFEFADDSPSLNSSKFIYKEHFTVTEMTSMKKEMWYDWLKYRVRCIRRQFLPSSWKTIFDTLLCLVLIAIFTKYARDCFISLQTESRAETDDYWITEKETIHKMISNFKEEIRDFEMRAETKSNNLEQYFSNYITEDKGWKESVLEELKQIKNWQAEMSLKMQSVERELEEKTTKTIIPPENTPENVAVPISTYPLTYSLQNVHPNRRPLLGVNTANSLIGASIDHSCSSRPVSAKDGIFYDIMSYFGTFQEGYVLLDRDVLTPGEAWCTYDNRATLSIKLARLTIPTAVSYQHVRWSGIIPNHAPKVYDVVACLDACCTKSESLVTNCQYKVSEDGYDEQEQFCSVTTASKLSPVNHVQFRFRKNHGNMEKTCAYLVRVYGDPLESSKTEKTSTLDNVTESKLEAEVATSISESY